MIGIRGLTVYHNRSKKKINGRGYTLLLYVLNILMSIYSDITKVKLIIVMDFPGIYGEYYKNTPSNNL